MKKLTAILLALALVSCAKTDDIAAGLETYREVYDAGAVSAGTAPETRVNGIVSPELMMNGGKYYFELSRYGSYPSGGGIATGSIYMLAYADAGSGNWGYACADPLCSHDNEEVCRYAGLREFCFTDTLGTAYAYRYSHPHSMICLVDLSADTVKTVYTTDILSTYLIGFDGGKLYFLERIHATDDRQTEVKTRFSAIDHGTGEVTEVAYLPETWQYPMTAPEMVVDGHFYFRTGSKVVRTDLHFTEITEIIETEFGISEMYLDQNTGELYVSSIDRTLRKGSLYRYSDGKTEKLTLPHEDIFTFILTEDRIYYTVFDPVYYGVSVAAQYMKGTDGYDPDRYAIYDYAGGRMYAVDRDNLTGDAELVCEFSGIGNGYMPNFYGAAVVGNCLYFSEYRLATEVVGGTEYMTTTDVNKIRMGLDDGTFTRIAFE